MKLEFKCVIYFLNNSTQISEGIKNSSAVLCEAGQFYVEDPLFSSDFFIFIVCIMYTKYVPQGSVEINFIHFKESCTWKKDFSESHFNF